MKQYMLEFENATNLNKDVIRIILEYEFLVIQNVLTSHLFDPECFISEIGAITQKISGLESTKISCLVYDYVYGNARYVETDKYEMDCYCPYHVDISEPLFYCQSFFNCPNCYAKKSCVCAWSSKRIVFSNAEDAPTFECSECLYKYFPCLDGCATYDTETCELTTRYCAITNTASFNNKLNKFVTEDGDMDLPLNPATFGLDGMTWEPDGPDGGLGTQFECLVCGWSRGVTDK